MDFITNKISIDLMTPAEPVVIYAVQGERYARSVQISLLCAGAPWQIPDGTLIAIRYGSVLQTCGYYDTLPDGSCAYSYEGNTIAIILAPQMMCTAGTVMTQVELCHGEQLLATFSFKLQVELNPSGGILEPETYINWLQWMENRLEEKIKQLTESGEITGPEGPAGVPATLLSSVVTYQVSDSGTIIPSGTWSSNIPVVAQGKYLWTRTTNTFNTGNPVVSYSVSRMGLDGSGSVSSVASISPDENGNVPLAAENIGALPISGGTMEGPINMNGQTLSGLNSPKEDSEAATKGYTLGLVKRAAPRNLLDNSDFRNPVNQRGQTVYTEYGYSLDRWMFGFVDDGTIQVNTNSVTINNGWIYQFVEHLDTTKQYTLAWGDDAGYIFVNNNPIRTDISGYPAVVIDSAQGRNLVWAALYEGEYTIESLPEYQPKGYAAELAECMRYYQKGDQPIFEQEWFGSYKGTLYFYIPMRVAPTVTLTSGDGTVPIYVVYHSIYGCHWGSETETYLNSWEASADL